MHGATIILACVTAMRMPPWIGCPRRSGSRSTRSTRMAASVHHAQLTVGNGMIMLGSVNTDNEWGRQIAQPPDVGMRETQSPCVIVADVDAYYARAKNVGAGIVMDISDQAYGGRGYSCRDPEGHLWWFGSYDPWKADA